MEATMATLPADYLNEIINKAETLEGLISGRIVDIETVGFLSHQAGGTNEWFGEIKEELLKRENENQMDLFDH